MSEIKHHAEPVGSLLRPSYLKEARSEWQSGGMALSEFKRIEDRAVDECVALQEQARLDVITDGEMRRFLFMGTLTEAVEGIGPTDDSQTLHWHVGDKHWDYEVPVGIIGKLRRRRSLATEEYVYARARATRPIKVTLPSPMLLGELWSPAALQVYDDPFDLFVDAAEILRQEMRELAEVGCEYIQIDAPELATLVDPSMRDHFHQQLISPERMLSEGVELLDDLAASTDITVAMHLCRGNNEGAWMARGGYDVIANAVFKHAPNFDVFLLEYDDERSGSFEVLADVPDDKRVLLGLVSTKRNVVETEAEIVSRIDEAASHFPREQLGLCTQCGFASTLAGNPIEPAVQDAKLRLIGQIAARVWA